MQTEYTVEGFEQETVDERIEELLALWNVDEDTDDEGYVHYMRQRAFDVATSFPSEIALDVFVMIVEARGIKS